MSRVLLIAWDSADWRLLRPLMEQGQMPHLRKLVAEGSSGDLGMRPPRLASSIWTSVVTGKRAHKHRVLRPAGDPGPEGGGVPQRRCSALWNILDRSGLASIVVGWPVTHPAESVRGVVVSDGFIRLGIRNPSQVPESGLRPTRLLGRVSDLLLCSNLLGPEAARALVPEDLDPSACTAPTLECLRMHAAELSSVQAIASALVQWEPWDFMAVRYPGILFPGPMDQGWDPSVGFLDRNGDRLLSRSLVSLDRMLGALVHLVGPETRTVLVAGGLGRPDPFGSLPSLAGLPMGGAAARDRGMVAVSGPGIRVGASLVGASILDVTPTILRAFGLPIGADMDGAVLPVFEDSTSVNHLTRVPGWDPPDIAPSPGRGVETSRSGRRLCPYGPVGITPEERYNLASDLIDYGRWSQAACELEALWIDPGSDLRSGLLLMRCRLLLRQFQEARDVFDALLARLRNASYEDASLPPSGSHGTRLDQNALWYLEAELLEREGRLDAAMRIYQQMLKVTPTRLRRDLHLRLAEGFLRKGERLTAIHHFVTACTLDATHVPSFLGLSRAYLLARRFQDAVTEARRLIELDPANPRAHFLLGVALTQCGHPDWAIESLEEAVRRAPLFPQAHRRLARIYLRHLNNPIKARHHFQLFVKTTGIARVPTPRPHAMRDETKGLRGSHSQGRMPKLRQGKPGPPVALG